MPQLPLIMVKERRMGVSKPFIADCKQGAAQNVAYFYRKRSMERKKVQENHIDRRINPYDADHKRNLDSLFKISVPIVF